MTSENTPVAVANEKLTDEQMSRFQAWRTEALNQAPYLAAPLFALSPVSSNWTQTIAVDKHYRCYVNFAFMDAQTSTFGGQALLHEVGHLVQDHMNLLPSLGMDDGNLGNIAGDMSINDDLRDMGCRELIEFGAILPEHYKQADHQSPDVYYEALLQRRDNEPSCSTCGTPQSEQPQQGDQQDSQQGDQQGGGQSGDQQGDQQGGGQSGDQQGDQQGGGQSGGQQASGCPDCGSVYSGCGSASGAGAGYGEMDSSDDMGGEAPAVSQADHEVVRIKAAVDMQDYVSKGRGTLPAGFEALVESVFSPSSTPWRSVLRALIRQAIRRKRGYRDQDRGRVSRRSGQRVVDTATGRVSRRVIPGYSDPKVSAHYHRDTSGSMPESALKAINNDIATLARAARIRDEDLIVTDVDAQVHATFGYKSFDDLKRVSGRGGTDMRKAIEFSMEADTEPAFVVVATDGFTPWPTLAPPFPVIVLLTQGAAAPSTVPDWAKVIVIDEGLIAR